MPISRLLLIVMANVAVNAGLIWMLCRLCSRRRRADREALDRRRRLLMQQVRGLETTMAHGIEVTS